MTQEFSMKMIKELADEIIRELTTCRMLCDHPAYLSPIVMEIKRTLYSCTDNMAKLREILLEQGKKR